MNLQYPLVCFDLDGTLVDDTVYIWKTLHESFETDPEARERAYRDYFDGRISYPEWFAHDLELLFAAGATQPRIRSLLDSLRPMAGAVEVMQELRRRGHILAIISGSLDIVVDHLFDTSWFRHVLVNRIFFDEHGRISGGIPTPYDLEGKADGLRHLATLESLTPEQTVFVGDNSNDVWIARAAGLSIAFNCKSDELRQVSNVEVAKQDIHKLLQLIC